MRSNDIPNAIHCTQNEKELDVAWFGAIQSRLVPFTVVISLPVCPSLSPSPCLSLYLLAHFCLFSQPPNPPLFVPFHFRGPCLKCDQRGERQGRHEQTERALPRTTAQCNRAYFMPHLSFTVSAVAALVSATATDYNSLQLTTTSCDVK